MDLGQPIVRFKLVFSTLLLSALVPLSSCDGREELKEKPSAVTSRITGDMASGHKENPKYPVSADTERILALVIVLAETDAQREAIKSSHADWLKLRESHCGAMGTLEKEGATGAAGNCYVSLDQQRGSALNHIRMALLLGKKPLPTTSTAGVNTSIAFEASRYNNQVAVAPGGAVAAVSAATGEIDIYDLVSGQRLRSFSGERLAVRAQFSGNGRLLFVGKQRTRSVKILDVYGGDELEQINEVMGPYVLLDGGRLLVYADGASLGIYDVPNSKSLAAGLFAKNTIWTLAVESSGKYVAAATRDGWISLWQIVPIGEGGEMTARPISETKLYGNNEYVNEMEFFEDGQKLLAVSSKGNIDVVSLPDVKRTRTMGVLGAKLDSLSRISGTDKFVLLTKRHSAKGKVLTVLDLAADTGMVVDERRQFLSVVPVADTKGKLLFVSGRGMWTKELHTTGAEESLSNLMARIASIALPLQSTATITPRPSAKNVLPNTRVESVGVYEGTLPGGRKRRPRERVSGTVTVTVGLQRAPLALVLSSYEPVNWIIRSGGARVTHVLLSGRAESTVIGVPEADIMRIGGGRGYPSTGNRRNRGQSQRDTAALNASAMQYLGRGIDRFQGAYTGSSFSIGSQSTAGTGVAQKWVDSNGQVHYGDRAP